MPQSLYNNNAIMLNMKGGKIEYVDEWMMDYSNIPWERGIRTRTKMDEEVDKILKEVFEDDTF